MCEEKKGARGRWDGGWIEKYESEVRREEEEEEERKGPLAIHTESIDGPKD